MVLVNFRSVAIIRRMSFSVTRIVLVLQTLHVCAFASNTVVNLSHYDGMRPDFTRMRDEGVVGVIHEATFPRFDSDAIECHRETPLDLISEVALHTI